MMSTNNRFSFQLLKTRNHARAGIMRTAHGEVTTPRFMPVGTLGTVKALDSQDLKSMQAEIILANTYHLFLRPGMQTVLSQQGVHGLMNWDWPVLTDSGGFQVFSLGSNVKMTADGANFVSHLNGEAHFFTPEKAIEIQRQIGADIIMAFDQCTLDKATSDEARVALDRTHAWAQRCFNYWQENKLSHQDHYQALFGIIQGAMHRDLRIESAKFITSLDFDGIAIGGETVGYNMLGTVELMDWIRELLPENKPHYGMGIGLNPQDIIDAVWAGYDIFDCVAPTRIARNGSLYTGYLEIKNDQPVWETEFNKGRLQIGNAAFKQDSRVLDDHCDCFTCVQGYSRAYLHHLYRTGELSYFRLASIHNLRMLLKLNEDLRAFILS